MRSWKEFGNTPGRRIYLHRFLEVDIHTASGNVNYRISHKFCLHSPPPAPPRNPCSQYIVNELANTAHYESKYAINMIKGFITFARRYCDRSCLFVGSFIRSLTSESRRRSGAINITVE